MVVDALHHRRNALQPHAGVDAGSRQVDALAARLLLILHEHQIPDFDEAVAILLRRSRRAAPDMVAMVIEDFAARRSEEHTSELQSLMRISYAVFCLKKKKIHNNKEQQS